MQAKASQGLYIFNLIHNDFVKGDESVLPTAVTRKIAVRQYVFLMLVIALPIIILITSLVAIAGYPIDLLLLVELLTALIACAYFVLTRYLKDRELRRKGQIIYGEVIRHDILPYSDIGTITVTRIFYRFLTPEKERIIDFIDCPYIAQRLPDGRKYPPVGTAIAILYANNTNHKLL
ncbi:MAG: hypothetical protein Phog2KO_17220 [Phototrophicaceae bacterium]